MTDFKNTLNLPKTSFPMKGNLPSKEPLIQKNGKKKIYMKKFYIQIKTQRNLFFTMDLLMQMVIFILVMQLIKF